MTLCGNVPFCCLEVLTEFITAYDYDTAHWRMMCFISIPHADLGPRWNTVGQDEAIWRGMCDDGLRTIVRARTYCDDIVVGKDLVWFTPFHRWITIIVLSSLARIVYPGATGYSPWSRCFKAGYTFTLIPRSCSILNFD